MKFIIYGGCHANHIGNALKEKIVQKENVDIKTIINFQLIKSKKAFPWQDINDIDGFICSPVNNKKGYNTKEILEYCRSRKIKTFVYPWLRFDGYFPFIKRVMNGWKYNICLNKNLNCEEDTPDKQRIQIESFLAKNLSQNKISNHIEKCLADLKYREKTSNADFILSEFIENNLKDELLFFTPEHACNAVYDVLVKSIINKFDLTSKYLDEFLTPTEQNNEVQSRFRVPILKEVSEYLGISDRNHLYYNSIISPKTKIYLEDYLLTCVNKNSGICKAKQNTFLSSSDQINASQLQYSSILKVSKGQELLFLKYERGKNAKILITILHDMMPSGYFKGFIYEPHWEINFLYRSDKVYLNEDIRNAVTK